MNTRDAAIAVDKVSFGAGGVIDLGYGADERRTTGSRTLMTFSELGAEGRAALKGWSFENAGAGTNTSIALRVTENAVVLDVLPKGTSIVFR